MWLTPSSSLCQSRPHRPFGSSTRRARDCERDSPNLLESQVIQQSSATQDANQGNLHNIPTWQHTHMAVQRDAVQSNMDLYDTQHTTTHHNTSQHTTTHYNTTQHNTTQHNTTQHNTTQHNTTRAEKRGRRCNVKNICFKAIQGTHHPHLLLAILLALDLHPKVQQQLHHLRHLQLTQPLRIVRVVDCSCELEGFDLTSAIQPRKRAGGGR